MRFTNRVRQIIVLLLVLCFHMLTINSQNTFISKEAYSLKTYPFSDPNPNPILLTNPKIYPYFNYEGYSAVGDTQEWNIIKMSNDYVEVLVMPQAGGKVWGAIEKSTGQEFIYRNEVMKFRNISMRGPWTSGGIEFNFGIIGHHPSTATPVDYVIQNHEDGSVSCTVGNIDLPSRTQWRVKIVLPKDKAYFETQTLWYNPGPTSQSYYNWMTAAAPAKQDFEFFTPGDKYLKHSGEAMPWPIDKAGRNLSLYKENNFGPSKSYHVVGELNDFFGGYYHDSNYGFGHWSEYEEMPGQKLWLWALSRAGGIWEDLLTDTDGQYIEFQAGRQFVQYSPDAHVNPVTQANFESHSSDLWREIWFPVISIGGISDASEKAVMNVELENDMLNIGINSFQDVQATLEIISEGEIVLSTQLALGAMEVYKASFDLNGIKNYKVRVEELDLLYDTQPGKSHIDRPFHANAVQDDQLSVEQIYRQGEEDVKFRLYAEGLKKFKTCLLRDPEHSGALVAAADIYYRQGSYDIGLQYIYKALRLDTYDPSANYIAGLLYRGKNDMVNAKESLGWAARSLLFRSAAYAQIGEIWLSEGKIQKAKKYSDKSLDFNRYNINALMVKAVAARIEGKDEHAGTVLNNILEIDPLNHFSFVERYLLSGAQSDRNKIINSHRSEMPVQTYLELAIAYYNMGRIDESIIVLELAPQDPLIDLWWVFIKQDPNSKYLQGILEQSPEFVFPFRRETLAALVWANHHIDHWKFKYYLALNLWGKGRMEEAAALLKECESTPDFDVFYRSRGFLLKELEGVDELSDLTSAFNLDSTDNRNWRALIAYHSDHKRYNEELSLCKRAFDKYPDNYAIGIDFTRALLHQQNYQKAIEVLGTIHVLPFEGASEGRFLYEQSHYGRALELFREQDFHNAIALLEASKRWPERLGVGQPYDPDERMANFLMAQAYYKLGMINLAEEHLKMVIVQSIDLAKRKSILHLLGLMALSQTGNTNEVDEFISKLKSCEHADSEITNWVLSKYKNRDFINERMGVELSAINPVFFDLIKIFHQPRK